MSTEFAAIRNGLADRLKHLNDTEKWIQVSAYALASPTPPSVQVMPSKIDYDLVMARGGDCVYMTVQAIVAINFDIAGQQKLDLLLADGGPLSVKAVIQGDCKLGGVVDDLRVTTNTGYQVYNLAGRGACLGCDWEVEILTKTV